MKAENRKLILVPDRISAEDISFERGLFGPNFEVIPCEAKFASEIDETLLRKADAILAWQDLHYTPDIIAKLDNCKILVRAGAGFDNVNLEAAGKKGIFVCNVPDYGTDDVADHAISLMMTLSREIVTFNKRVREERNWKWSTSYGLRRLKGATFGIVGLGRIGSAAALRAKAFGMNVCYYDPYLADGYDKVLGVTKIENLKELFKLSDVVSLHSPLTSETKGMVDGALLNCLRPGSLLVNTARGEIVDLDALYDVLKSGHLRGAGLDVLSCEPPDEANKLIKAWRNNESWLGDRLIITPHMAFFNKESYAELRTKAALTIKSFFEAQAAPKNIVNKKFL